MDEPNRYKHLKISVKDLLILKQHNYDAFQFIMSLSEGKDDYCDILDKEKLKSECEQALFDITDLFTKKQIADAAEEQAGVAKP